MFSFLILIPMFAPVPEPDPAEQKALAALEQAGFRPELTDDKSRHVKELAYSSRARDGSERPKPSDKDLANLAALHNLEKLYLNQAANDAALDHIRSPVLRDLSLEAGDVTDESLKKLAKFEKLTILHLSSHKISNVGLKTVASLPALRSLYLGETDITDRGLKELEKTQIGDLGLGGTRVGDAGISSLGKMPALYGLHLSMTEVTDKGLAEMAAKGAFPKLQRLGLSATSVSDEGLKALHDPKALPALKSIVLDNTHVTDAGVAAFEKARPKVRVIRRQ